MSLKKSKQSNSEIGMDLISRLPDPILRLILSRLPCIEEQVRTSILSTRWRYLWTSVPHLNIYCRSKPSYHFKNNTFKEFVYWVLANRTLDLESFRLSCSDYCDMLTIGRWIHSALMRKVKVLELIFCLTDENEAIELPHCLVNCDSLKELSLYLYRHRLRLPSITGFCMLRVLEFDEVELLDHELVQAFFIGCPLLENLSLIDCIIYKLDFLCISCPNLKTLRIDNHCLVDCKFLHVDDDGVPVYKNYDKEGLCESLNVLCPKLEFFKYGGHVANHFSFDQQSLKKAVIQLEDMEQKDIPSKKFMDGVCELFSQVAQVESLSMNHYFVQSVNVERDPDGGFSAFLPNLKALEIKIDCFLMGVLICILRCSPNLESLHLIFQEDIFSEEFESFVEELDVVDNRRILTRHLKRVEFRGFNGEKESLAIAQFLLEHGNALEEMVFSWSYKERYYKKSMEAMNEVSKFKKASSVVKVITLLE